MSQLSPERRRLRSAIATAAKFGNDDTELRQDYAVATIKQFIAEKLAEAPPVTPEMIAEIRACLPPVGES